MFPDADLSHMEVVMPGKKGLGWYPLLVIIGLLLSLSWPALVAADGGPWTEDRERWSSLQEVEQIAVVQLGSGQTAQVDLFISLLDSSGETQQVVFFFPLGPDPTGFTVVEEDSQAFEQALTNPLDQTIAQENEHRLNYRARVLYSLLGGMMVINGGWSWPLWVVLTLAGCGVGSPAGPVATYETENSRIELYQIDPDTDLQQLASAAGLAPAVQETLSRLHGQQIAVVTLQTQPPARETSAGPAGQPGIHMAWTTDLVADAGGSTYDYPLGTGQAWARPIEKTRVYVIAPPGIDFTVDFPRLGREDNDYDLGSWLDEPAYRVDDVVGEFGRIWRVVYTASNASEDIRITRLPGMAASTQAALRQQQWRQLVRLLTLPLSLLFALALWVTAWRYTMPPMLGTRYRWRDWSLWRDAIGWALAYPLSNAAALVLVVLPVGVVWALAALLGQSGFDLQTLAGFSLLAGVLWAVVALAVLAASSVGVISGYFFARARSRGAGVSRGRALGAYAVVVVLSNLVYAVLALAYAALVGAL
jgi:hypothetical protein